MKTGIVKWFNDSKGFGMITCDDKDIFVHYTAIADVGFKSLPQDCKVTLEILDTERGKQAVNVRKVK